MFTTFFFNIRRCLPKSAGGENTWFGHSKADHNRAVFCMFASDNTVTSGVEWRESQEAVFSFVDPMRGCQGRSAIRCLLLPRCQ